MVGHQKIIERLEQSVKKDKNVQAYIFSGPEGLGKFTLAKKFAESLIGGRSLKKLMNEPENNKFMADLIVLSPEISEKKGIMKEKEIKIERIREARKEMLLFPAQGKYRVLIINNAHKMSKASQNALLKVIEEPNETSVIILITHEDGKLLPTIKSRCQKIKFNLVDESKIKKLWEESVGFKKNISVTEVNEIVSLSAGRPGWAVKMARDMNKLELYKSALKELKIISAMDIRQRMEMAEKFSKNIPAAIEKLELWIWIMHSVAVKDFNNASRFIKIIEKIESGLKEIKNTNANGRLLLENLIINL